MLTYFKPHQIWLQQKCTTVLMLATIMVCVICLMLHIMTIELLGSISIKVLIQLLMLLLSVHGWRGANEIALDYIKLPKILHYYRMIVVLWLIANLFYLSWVLW